MKEAEKCLNTASAVEFEFNLLIKHIISALEFFANVTK